MTAILRRIGFACLLAAAAAQGSAQSLAPADPARTPGWVFTPTLAAAAAWDSNVVLAGVRAPTESDQVTLLTGSADGQYRARHHLVTFGYAGSLEAYRRLTELNSFDQRLRVDTRHEVARRVTLALHNGLARVPTTDYVELSGVPFLRTGSLMDDARATLTVTVGPHTSIGGGYAFEWVRFDESSPFAAFLKGGQSHTAFGNLSHQVEKRVWVGAVVSLRRALVAQGGGEFDIFETSGTVRYQPAATLTVSGSLGVSRLNDHLRHTSQLGPVWSVSADRQMERASLHAAYVRSYVPSFGLGGTLQNQELSADVRMPFAKNRLYWQAGLSWRRNEPITPGEQSLKSLWLQVSGGYSVLRWLRLEAYYWRTQQDSELRGGRVDRDRIGVQVITSTPMRLK
jgi:hypothetical protein